jgi:hypothetical protein
MIYIPNVWLKSCQNDFIYQTGGSTKHDTFSTVINKNQKKELDAPWAELLCSDSKVKKVMIPYICILPHESNPK